MSKFYSLDITLNAPYDIPNIRKILDKTFELGFIYYGPFADQISYVPLSKEKAEREILKQAERNFELHLRAKICDSRIDFWITRIAQNSIVLSIILESSHWLKSSSRFIEDTAIDWSRYIRLLTAVASDFIIRQIEIEIHY